MRSACRDEYCEHRLWFKKELRFRPYFAISEKAPSVWPSKPSQTDSSTTKHYWCRGHRPEESACLFVNNWSKIQA